MSINMICTLWTLFESLVRARQLGTKRPEVTRCLVQLCFGTKRPEVTQPTSFTRRPSSATEWTNLIKRGRLSAAMAALFFGRALRALEGNSCLEQNGLKSCGVWCSFALERNGLKSRSQHHSHDGHRVRRSGPT